LSRHPAPRHGAASAADALETELAFAVPPERASAVELALRRAGARTVRIESHYLDTEDRRLAAAGLSLRVRRMGALWEQTLKAPAGADPSIRHEHTVPRPGAWDVGGPPVDPRLHQGTLPGLALAAALAPRQPDGAVADDDAKPRPALAMLAPGHASFVRRQQVTVASGASVIEVAFDRGEIRADGRSLPVSEIELELKSGDGSALLALARETIVEHGVWRQVDSKSARGDRLRHGEGVLPPPSRAGRRSCAGRWTRIAGCGRSSRRSCCRWWPMAARSRRAIAATR
jgi:inorganic triphosphatase YgiF